MTGLTSTGYYYRLRAQNGIGTSTNSATIGPVAPAGYTMLIQFGAYTRGKTLTNFPALQILSTSLTNVLNNGTNVTFAYSQFGSTNGWDLRFTESTQTTNLNYEIEQWATGSRLRMSGYRCPR